MPPMDPAATPAPEKADEEPKAEEAPMADDGPVIESAGLADEGGPGAGGEAPEIPAPVVEVERAPSVELAAAPAQSAEPWAPSIGFMTASAIIVAALDLGSKEWAKWALAGPNLTRSAKRIEGIPGYLDFIFAQNPGGAWSFLRSMSDGLRRPFFLFVSAAAIVFIVQVYTKLDRRQWAMRWGLPLALGGAIGNLIDRVRYGWVVDFIDFYWKGSQNEMHWPTFNVADVAIVVGVGLMAIDLFSLRRMKDPEPAPPAETASGAA